MESSVILTNEQIEHKTRRIAYQIYETNSKEEEVIIAGIQGNGFIFAKNLAKILNDISSLNVIICEVNIDKKNPFNKITTNIRSSDYKDKSVVLVDDVLNSGTTLMHGIKHFLEVPLSKFKTAVLVNRNHKKYPVKADFKGISLSTSLHDHVNVIFEDSNAYALLE